ncbi:Gfo/Idh/MocA family oxidoreductase [Tessaracoccus sp. Z1128]
MAREGITVGLIGTGRIGADHARTINTLDNIAGLVVADFDSNRAAMVAAELNARQVDPDKLISQVDALIVATPTNAHAEYIMAAAKAGVPVFTEKPVALDVPTTKRVVDTVAQTGTLVQVGFMRRFDKGYINARKLLGEGYIGELRRGHAVTGDYPPPPASYIPGSGGIFKDCTIHDADIIRWVTGREVVEAYVVGASRGAAYFGEQGDIDEGAGVLTLDDGSFITLQVSRNNAAGYDIRLELAGSKETISVGFAEFMAVTSAEPDFTFAQAGARYPNFYPRFVPAYASEISEFVSSVLEGGESKCTLQDALEALYICEALDLSLAEHRPVRLDEIKE